jgi:hypothetical protein
MDDGRYLNAEWESGIGNYVRWVDRLEGGTQENRSSGFGSLRVVEPGLLQLGNGADHPGR